MSTGTVIRLAREEDLGAINDIYNYYVAHSTCTYEETAESLEGRRRWLAEHGEKHPAVVAELDGRIVGWGSLSGFRERSGYRFTVENSVYVHPEFQRRGIGAMILQDLIERGRRLGHRAMMALIDAEQAGSVRLHERFGFEEVGRLREVGFKAGKWLDVIYMEKLM